MLNKLLIIIDHSIKNDVLIDRILRLDPNYYMFLDNHYLVRTDLNCESVYDQISVGLGNHDIFITKIETMPRNYWGHMNVELWDWLGDVIVGDMTNIKEGVDDKNFPVEIDTNDTETIMISGEFYFCRIGERSWIIQFDRTRLDKDNVCNYFYMLNACGELIIDDYCESNGFIPATPKQKQLLIDKVKEITGDIFNEKTKRFVKPNNMIKSRNLKIIESSDWDDLVKCTYKKPYCLQQQNDCMDRQLLEFKVPSEEFNDEGMHDDIPAEINAELMGVKLATWLARDPNTPLKNQESNWELELFWERNFYPDFETVVNDLYSKGLLEAGEYAINID